MMKDIASIRKEYSMQELNEQTALPDPIQQFESWWKDLSVSSIEEMNAMTLATADANGMPSARIVLLKGVDAEGFSFYTNYESRKGEELSVNPHACLVFFWKELERQVRVEGVVKKATDFESDLYFKSRPEGSKIGAWSSPQSSVIVSRETIEENVAVNIEKFKGKEINRPPHWGGYIVLPQRVEFWQGRENRLHDRILYTKNEKGTWNKVRLAP